MSLGWPWQQCVHREGQQAEKCWAVAHIYPSEFHRFGQSHDKIRIYWICVIMYCFFSLLLVTAFIFSSCVGVMIWTKIEHVPKATMNGQSRVIALAHRWVSGSWICALFSQRLKMMFSILLAQVSLTLGTLMIWGHKCIPSFVQGN